jgi:DNA mismatch endonuclease (patch repair protein)
LPGKPDLVFASRRKVIFVHGCFWHGHDCARGARVPKSNVDYWAAKVRRNRERDAKTIAALHDAGWQVLIIWECETKDRDQLTNRLSQFLT